MDTNNPSYSSLAGVLFNKSGTKLLEYPEGRSDAVYSIPNSVINVGDFAFYGSSLIDVTIPDSVNNIGVNAFTASSLTGVTIGSGVTNIGGWAFSGCNNLTTVTIPEGVTSIGNFAFNSCYSLSAINVDVANVSYSSLDGILFNKGQTTLIQYPCYKSGSYTVPNSVTTIGYTAFAYCINLTGITIGNSVTVIEDGAFLGCTSLKIVTIPNNVTTIPGYLCSYCTSLTNVTIGSNVTGIGAFAFSECFKLTNVTIPDNVTSIGNLAFENCSSLTTVTIGNAVTNIVVQAFLNCSSLKQVYFEGNAPTADSSVFQHDNKATAYYLPGTTGWGSTFFGIPTALWSLPYPLILNGSLGVRSNQFGFTVSWATNLSVVVAATPDLKNPNWSPLTTNALNSGTSYFSDPQWTNYPNRFYRVQWSQ